MSRPLLQVDNLSVEFITDEGRFTAVSDVSFMLRPGEIVGLVGESGCGKSVTSLSVLRLVPVPVGKISSGSIRFKDKEILSMPREALKSIRGKSISMIFQEPSAALSPLLTVGDQLTELLKLHENVSKKEAWDISRNWLKKVGISDPDGRMRAYPYHLSGGMQQRVMIAMALMLNPAVLIADEPTTALDVTTQAQIFNLMLNMKNRETGVLLITHDMGVVWNMCDRVYVMYASSIVEEGSRDAVFKSPAHPYTIGLLNSIPNLYGKKGRLSSIPGSVPSPLDYPKGCRFMDRCPHAFDRCSREYPPLVAVDNEEEGETPHKSACFIAGDIISGVTNQNSKTGAA